MRYIITTDTHIGHCILRRKNFRPENFCVKIWNKIFYSLKPDDILIHLGDVCMGRDGFWHKYLMDAVPCRRWLVIGNHDHKSYSWYLDNGWHFVGKTAMIERFGYKILFSHVPQEPLGHFDVNVHGHFHNTDHRVKDPVFNDILCDKHYLVMLEHHYEPMLLKNIIRKWQKGENGRIETK